VRYGLLRVKWALGLCAIRKDIGDTGLAECVVTGGIKRFVIV
jgi:hypothetical protein